jgi:hypothetical protein
VLDLWRWCFDFLLRRRGRPALRESLAHEAASRSVLALPGLTADAALRSVLASSGSLARHAGSALFAGDKRDLERLAMHGKSL